MRRAAAILSVASLACSCPAPARGDIGAPFTEWFQSVAASSQALADGDGARAEALARAALTARSAGAAADRGRLALGLALRASGLVEDATPLVSSAVASLDARTRDDVLRSLGPAPTPSAPASPAPAPTRADAPPSAEDQLEAAGRFVADARPHDALAALDALPPGVLTGAQQAQAKLLRAWSSLQLGRRDVASTLAQEIVAGPGADLDAGTRIGAELILARVAARAGRYDEAIARYARLASGPPRPVPGLTTAAALELPNEAAYLAAWLPFDARQWRRAADGLARFAARHPRSPRATDARWFSAWALFRGRRVAEARRTWASLEHSQVAAGALYWQARVSPPSRATALYARAIEAEPGGWYAFLSASRLTALRHPASPLPVAAPAPGDLEIAPASAAAMARAAALLELGLRDSAVALLREAAASPGARTSAQGLAELADAAGETELTLRIARDQLPLSRRALRWQHPLAFGAGLDALAAAAGADPLLFRALIRRESVFRADARSRAGAEGLVQLMPYTAERLSAVLGAVGSSPVPDLRDRSTSLALGAAYLGLLLDRFTEPAAAIAAYNGGPVPIAAWAADHAGAPLDESVEELPFRETRRYVKAVMAAYATYRHLHAGAPAAIDGSRRLARPRDGVAF